MAAFTWIALRNLMPTHKVGKQYKLVVPLKKLDKRIKTTGKQNESQGGQIETIIHRRQIEWDFETVWLRDSVNRRAQTEEFLNSIDSGEVFQFDRLSNTTVSIAPANMKKVGIGFEIQRDPSGFLLSFGFKMIEQ